MDGETKGTEANIEVARIEPRKGNRSACDVHELAASLRSVGQLNAIIVRPIAGGRYELIAGERRCAAAEEVGLKTLRARVVEATDAQAELLAAIDNLDRIDLTPLEEAAVYARLLELRVAMDPTDLAARVGRTVNHIRQRLRLGKLEPRIRKLLETGALDVGAALVIAQAPASVQKRVAPELERAAQGTRPDRSPRDVAGKEPAGRITRAAVAEILTNHSHRLTDAPFDPTDAELVPGAGACGNCPKRTGKQGALIEVLDEADVCLDDECWGGKADTTWADKSAKAKAAGLKVLSDAEAKKVVDTDGSTYHSAPFVPLDGKVWNGREQVPVAKLVDKTAPRTIARAPETGLPVELVSRKDVEAALAAVEKRRKEAAAKSGKPARVDPYQKELAAAREKAMRNGRTHAVAVRIAGDVVTAGRVQLPAVAHALVAVIAHLVGEDAHRAVGKRRKLEPKKDRMAGGEWSRAIAAELAELGKGARKDALNNRVLALGVELAIAERIQHHAHASMKVPPELELLGLDLKDCAAEAERLLREAKAPKTKGGRKLTPKERKNVERAQAGKKPKPARAKPTRRAAEPPDGPEDDTRMHDEED